MAIQTTTEKVSLAAKYAADALYAAAYTSVPTSTAGTEVTGGAPAYARKSLVWTGTNPISASVTFDIPTGTTVLGVGVHTAVTAGTYLDGVSVTSQAFASQGQYVVAFSMTVA